MAFGDAPIEAVLEFGVWRLAEEYSERDAKFARQCRGGGAFTLFPVYRIQNNPAAVGDDYTRVLQQCRIGT